MGKKRLRKKLTSKGTRVNQRVKPRTSSAQQFGFALDAWLAKKPVMLTVENPDKSATNRRFIRVRADEYWGKPR